LKKVAKSEDHPKGLPVVLSKVWKKKYKAEFIKFLIYAMLPAMKPFFI